MLHLNFSVPNFSVKNPRRLNLCLRNLSDTCITPRQECPAPDSSAFPDLLRHLRQRFQISAFPDFSVSRFQLFTNCYAASAGLLSSLDSATFDAGASDFVAFSTL